MVLSGVISALKALGAIYSSSLWFLLFHVINYRVTWNNVNKMEQLLVSILIGVSFVVLE